jgi:hypothetical protein
MANYNNTILKTDNPEIFKAVIDRFKASQGEQYDHWYYDNHELAGLTAGGKQNGVSNYNQLPPDVQKAYLKELTEIHLRTRNDVFHDAPVELSKQFPGDKITCMFTFEDDWHFLETTVEYLNGNDTVVNHAYRPQLFTEYDLFDLIGKDKSQAILKKIHDFVVGLYDNKMIREGEAVRFRFTADEHRFIVTVPFGPHYDLIVYKAKETKQTDWVRVDPGDNDNKLPF